MNKKGFTLPELLAVIVVLAIIVGVAGASVLSIMNKAKNNTAKEMTDNLKDAAIFYVQDNELMKNIRCPDTTTSVKVKACDLKNNGLFEDNGKYCCNEKTGKNVEITVSLICDGKVSDYKATAPTNAAGEEIGCTK